MDQTVELFCGLEKPFSRIAEALGYAATSVDPDIHAEPNIVEHIAEGLAQRLPASPLIVWAAPTFNNALLDKEAWEQDGSFHPKTEGAQLALKHLRDTVGLLYALKPVWWFIEQPKSLARSMPLFAGFNRGYPSRNRRTVVHKQFGGERGVSDVWTNAFWWVPGSPDNSELARSDSGDCGRVPPYVYAQVFEQLESYRRSATTQSAPNPGLDQLN